MRKRFIVPRLPIPGSTAVYGLIIISFLLANSCASNPKFGGPYDYDGGESKVAEFTVFESHGGPLFWSKATKLRAQLFRDSIEWYRDNTSDGTFPYGDEYQRYNYVVTEGGDIFVAVWTVNGENGGPDLSELATDSARCRETNPGFGAISGPQTIMINFYPEEPTPPHKEVSPCWIRLPTGGRVGLLDALSKHFMLVQDDGKSIEDFDPEEWKPWTRKRVAYAGEIVVDVKRCLYTINNGSGTYQPENGDNLKSVADHFRQELNKRSGTPVAPAFVETVKKSGKRELAVYNSDIEAARIPDLSGCP